MDIDPAIRGTTFAAALEGAARDEQRKRDQREQERNNPIPLRPHPRSIIAEFQRSIAVKHSPVIQPLPKTKGDPLMVTEAQQPPVLSETQVKILKAGVDTKGSFKIGAVGRAIGKLLDDNLVIPGPQKGTWQITDAGRDAYNIHLAREAAANDQIFKATESGINLDDPALKPVVTPVSSSSSATADDLRLKLDLAEYELDVFKKAIEPIKAMMDEDGLSDKLVEYVAYLRQGLANESAIVNDINARAAADGKGYMDPRAYVDQLREQRAQPITTGINWYEVVIAPVIDLMSHYGGDEVRLQVEINPDLITLWISETRKNLTSMDQIADERTKVIEDLQTRLRNQDADRATVKVIVEAVCDLMDADGSSSQPIPAYIQELHKKAQMTEQHEATIESLRRCIEEMKFASEEWQRRATTADQTQRAAFILNELCSYLPDVEAYRKAREQSLRVIDQLAAQS